MEMCAHVRVRVCVCVCVYVRYSRERNKTSLRWSFLKYCVRGITTMAERFLQEKTEPLRLRLKAALPTTSLDGKRKTLRTGPT